MEIVSASATRGKAVEQAQEAGLPEILEQIESSPWDGEWRFKFSDSPILNGEETKRHDALIAAIEKVEHLSVEEDGEVDGSYIIVHKDESYYVEHAQHYIDEFNLAVQRAPFSKEWRINLPANASEDGVLAAELKRLIEESGEYTVKFLLVREELDYRSPHLVIQEKQKEKL